MTEAPKVRPQRRRTPRLRVAALVLLAVTLVGSSIGWKLWNSRVGGLICEEPAYAFGSTPNIEARNLSHVFVVKNKSSRPIRIVNEVVSCGCVTADLSGNGTIGPDQMIGFPVKVDWAGRDGPQSSNITLFTDDADTPRLTLTC